MGKPSSRSCSQGSTTENLRALVSKDARQVWCRDGAGPPFFMWPSLPLTCAFPASAPNFAPEDLFEAVDDAEADGAVQLVPVV